MLININSFLPPASILLQSQAISAICNEFRKSMDRKWNMITIPCCPISSCLPFSLNYTLFQGPGLGWAALSRIHCTGSLQAFSAQHRQAILKVHVGQAPLSKLALLMFRVMVTKLLPIGLEFLGPYRDSFGNNYQPLWPAGSHILSDMVEWHNKVKDTRQAPRP